MRTFVLDQAYVHLSEAALQEVTEFPLIKIKLFIKLKIMPILFKIR